MKCVNCILKDCIIVFEGYGFCKNCFINHLEGKKKHNKISSTDKKGQRKYIEVVDHTIKLLKKLN